MKNKKIFSLVIVCALVFSMFVAAIPFSQAGKPAPPTGNPQIVVEKFVLAGDIYPADNPEDGPIVTSGPVQFVIGVANTGDVDLSRVKLTDTSLSNGPVNIGTLAVDDYYLSDVFTEEWVEGDHVSTVASASGVYGGTTYSDTNVAYYTCSPPTEPAPEPAPIETLTSPNMAPLTESSNFGQSVAVSSGYIAIGAPEESFTLRHGPELQAAGRVYLYDETTKTLVKTLQSPNGEDEGHFGSTVAISGDYLIVGAIGEDSADVTGAGRVYVYSLSHLRTSPIELVSSNPTENSKFGWSLAGDGTDIVVGAPDEGAGVVYSYDLATGNLNYAISSPDPEEGSSGEIGSFGSAVAVSEGKLYVGDPFMNGAVFIYDAATGGEPTGSLDSPNSEINDAFGCRITVGGGYVFVGADLEQPEGSTSWEGRVHVYSAETKGWVATLASPDPTDGGRFGKSIASDGTYLVIGAPYENDDAGRAYVYSIATIADESVEPVVTLVSPNAAPGGYFGDLNSVAIDNGLIVIGASGEFVIGYDNGRAYIYSPG